MASTLRMILDAEQFSPKQEFLAGKKVKATFSIRRSQNDPRYEKTILFDFGGLSDEQLLELALASVKIKVQAMIRQLDPAAMLNPDSLSAVDVLKDVVQAPTRTGDPQAAAIRSVMKATGVDEETARALVSDAQAKTSKRKDDGKKGKAAA